MVDVSIYRANLVGRKTQRQIEYEIKLKKINQECFKYDNALQKMLAWLSNNAHKTMHEEFISNTTLQYLADPNKFKDPEPEEPDYNTSPDKRNTVADEELEPVVTVEKDNPWSYGNHPYALSTDLKPPGSV